MAVYLKIALDDLDVFEAHDLADTLVDGLRAEGLTIAPVADGSMGTLLFEAMHLATPLSEHHIAVLAHQTAAVARANHAVMLVQDRHEVRLTANEAENQTMIRTHTRKNQDTVIEVR